MKNLFNRQDLLVALVLLTPADIAGGGFSAKIPQGAWVTNIVGQKVAAFDTGGTTPVVTLTVGDGTTTFINAQSLAATGAVTAATTQKYYPQGGTITGTIAESAASGLVPAENGEVLLRIEYVQLGVGCEIQG